MNDEVDSLIQKLTARNVTVNQDILTKEDTTAGMLISFGDGYMMLLNPNSTLETQKSALTNGLAQHAEWTAPSGILPHRGQTSDEYTEKEGRTP